MSPRTVCCVRASRSLSRRQDGRQRVRAGERGCSVQTHMHTFCGVRERERGSVGLQGESGCLHESPLSRTSHASGESTNELLPLSISLCLLKREREQLLERSCKGGAQSEERLDRRSSHLLCSSHHACTGLSLFLSLTHSSLEHTRSPSDPFASPDTHRR